MESKSNTGWRGKGTFGGKEREVRIDKEIFIIKSQG